MNRLKELEEIANQLENMFKYDSVSSPQNSFDSENKSTDEIAEEIKRLDSEIEENISDFHDNIVKLDDVSNNLKSDTPTENIPSIISESKQMISQLKTIKRDFEAKEETKEELKKTYEERQARSNGYESYEEFSEEFKKRNTLKTFIEEVYGNRLEKTLDELTSRTDALNTIYWDCKAPRILSPFLDYSDRDLFKKAQTGIYENLSRSLFSQYRSLLQEIAENEKTDGTLDADVLDTLCDEYISKKFENKLAEEVEDNESMEEILSILKDGLNQKMFDYEFERTQENLEQIRLLKERFDRLPDTIKDIIKDHIFPADKTADDKFNELAKYSIKAKEILERKKVLDSLSYAKTKVKNGLSDENIDIGIRLSRYELDNFAETIEYEFTLPEEKNLSTVDMNKWDVFKNNKKIKDVIGETALSFFDKYLRDDTFEMLLITPVSTSESIELGYRAIWFKDAESVPYNILNFWREHGYSGEKPFLNIYEFPEETEAAKYIMSLDDDQIDVIKNLGIPGLIDIIDTVKENLHDFSKDMTFGKDDEWIANSSYEKIQESLGKMCVHYLKNGTDKEKYFTKDVALDLNFMKTEEHNPQRDGLIDILAENIGLDEQQKSNFKEHYLLFLDRLKYRIRKSPSEISSYEPDMIALSNYVDELKDMLDKSSRPKKLKKEAEAIEQYLIMGKDSVTRCEQAIDYLETFDSDEVQEYLDDEKNILNIVHLGERVNTFSKRLDTIKDFIFYKETPEGNLVAEIKDDLRAIKNFIETSSEHIKTSEVPEELTAERDRVLYDLIHSHDLINNVDVDYFEHYFSSLNDRKAAKIFNLLENDEKRKVQLLARQIYNVDKILTEPIIRAAVQRKRSAKEIYKLINYIPTLEKYTHFVEQYAECIEKDPKLYSNLLFELSNMDKGSEEILSAVNEEVFELKNVCKSLYKLKDKGILPTSYMLKNIYDAEDKNLETKSWLKTIESFEKGDFDAADELHRNLEYTRFRKIVDNEKIKRHVKNNFTFEEYCSIFSKESGVESQLDEQDRFEIECVAYEAGLLKEYILEVNKKAKELGKKTMVIPNLSYGYLPVSPIADELSEEGIEFLIGTKVGSTESHNNKEVINSRLFKKYRTKIIDEQPVIVVVDGTEHLVSRDGEHKSARYPDAFQGYLNQAIALNDSFGYFDIDYSDAGKTSEDMERLRDTEEFKRTVEVYKHVNKGTQKYPYSFKFWNTAKMDLIIRNNHEKIKDIECFSVDYIENPTMIFCNVGVLDEDIPDEIKERILGYTHEPAYFDDSEKIIEYDFGFDNYGVRYLNRLENEVKKAYGCVCNKSLDPRLISALIKFNSTGSGPVAEEA